MIIWMNFGEDEIEININGFTSSSAGINDKYLIDLTPSNSCSFRKISFRAKYNNYTSRYELLMDS